MPELASSPYIGHLTEAGETHEIVATEDIRSQQGAKLVAKGARIDRRVHGQLIQHKLLKPVEQSVAARDGVTQVALLHEARQVLEREPSLGALFDVLHDREAPVAALGRIPLEPSMALRLTVLRERLPRTFRHSLQVALASTAIGSLLKLSTDELGALAAAGLLHDIGELHIDPAIFDRKQRLNDEQRRQIYAHPMIAHAILNALPAYHQRVSGPVLEHHERLDGSGYPYGLSGAKIGTMGRILALGELIAGVCERQHCSYLEVILRFQAEKYGVDLTRSVATALRDANCGARSAPSVDKAALSVMGNALEQCVMAWRNLGSSQSTASPLAEPATLVAERLGGIKRSLARTGLAITDISGMVSAADSGSSESGELAMVLRESVYQTREIVFELRRRWPVLPEAASNSPLPGWMRNTDETCAAALARPVRSDVPTTPAAPSSSQAPPAPA
jgi:hypothetical protein